MTRISSRIVATITEDALPLEPFDFAIVESAAEVRIVDLQQESLRNLTSYDRGLACAERGELRWQKREAGWHLVFISDDDRKLPHASSEAELDECPGDTQPRRMLLRGWRDGDVFVDGRIPAPIMYPKRTGLAGFDVLAVTLRHYRLDGQALFRCVALEGVV